jgi:hypothetical protein
MGFNVWHIAEKKETSFFSSQDLIITSLSQNQLEYKNSSEYIYVKKVFCTVSENLKDIVLLTGLLKARYILIVCFSFLLLLRGLVFFVVVTCCSYGWCSVV